MGVDVGSVQAEAREEQMEEEWWRVRSLLFW